VRRRAAFTLVEALVTVALSVSVLVLLVGTFGSSVHSFVQGDDTLNSTRHLQLLLSYLKADIGMADAPPNRDLSASPATGNAFPKNVVHLACDPDSDQVRLFTHTLVSPPAGVSSANPIASKPPVHPVTRASLARAAWVQNAMVWVDAGRERAAGQPRQFVVNVRAGGTVNRVVYSYDPEARTVVRSGPEGTLAMASGSLQEFACSPYLEFVVAARRPDWPLELLKCWVEVHLKVAAPQKTDRIAKRAVEVRTRIVPRYLAAAIRGLSPF
jgi:hypothetical protein